MKTKKGEADLITLVIGMIPMILFIVLSGYILVENPVKTDLSTQIQFEEARFESMMALNHILVYNDTLERINNYSEFPADSNNVRNVIEQDIDESTSYLSDALVRPNPRSQRTNRRTNPRSQQETSTDSGRKFSVNITMPEEDKISVNSSSILGGVVSSEANIASPKTDPIKLEVILSRG